MTGMGETPLEMARRHVAEGEDRVARQAAIVARLRAQDHDTALAESLLAEFRQTVADMRAHLQILEAER